MKGHVRKRGSWEYIIDLGSDPATGKRRQRSKAGFPDKDAADEALAEALGDLRKGTLVKPSRQTVRDYLLDVWLPSRKPAQGAARGHRGQVSLATWDSYRGDLCAHVIPRIGAMKLQDVDADTLDRLYNELERTGGRYKRGLAPKTLTNVHGVLHKALADAVKRGHLARNPADAVEPPKASRPNTTAWTVEQLRGFIEHVRRCVGSPQRGDCPAGSGERLYAMWLLFATTGMRRGEVPGLTWEDIDLDNGTLRVEWTLGNVESKPTWKPRPKSEAGERRMSLDPATVAALRDHRRRQSEDRMRTGPRWQTRAEDWRGQARENLVFTWPDGRMVYPDRISDWFQAHCKAASLPRIRLHDVRHTYATAALASAQGWHEVKVISERLGHASVGITLDTYSHVLPAADAETAHTLARVILGGN